MLTKVVDEHGQFPCHAGHSTKETYPYQPTGSVEAKTVFGSVPTPASTKPVKISIDRKALDLAVKRTSDKRQF